MSNLGLREIRKALGISSEEVGNAIGMNPAYLLRIENGTIENPSYNTLIKIAEYFNNLEDIKNGTFKIEQYDSDFSKLILSFKYNELKEAYAYVKNNDDIKLYIDMSRFLSHGDLDAIKSIVHYRKSMSKFLTAKDNFKNSIAKNYKRKSIEEAIKNIDFNSLFHSSIDMNYEIEELVLNSDDYYQDFCSKLLEAISTSLERIGVDNFLKDDHAIIVEGNVSIEENGLIEEESSEL